MNILITGNMGYVGPVVVNHLRTIYPNATLIGFDMGYFAAALTHASVLPESRLDAQWFGDIRTIKPAVLQGIDAIVHLAAISNDPMGNRFEEVTMEINFMSSIRLAKMAKQAGVRSFVFASSCSMYGAAEGGAKTENAKLNPLTAYARSKVFTEKELELLADTDFTVTCLRFATACGASDRLRLDLVLNDFVAGAVASGTIHILSDGSPWRPLIHVKDMARAIEWAINREAPVGGRFLAINAGTNEWNYQVSDLAYAVAKAIPGTQVHINKDAAPDKRSYQVNFNLFKAIAPHHQPQVSLAQAIEQLQALLQAMQFKDHDFRNSQLMRLKMLNYLQETAQIDDQLCWKNRPALAAAHQPATAASIV